ncbi:hypothetical protein PoB_000716800 [Plakobranchus ocellatus]|uniref:Uncharacterized protein n=1 Tax=Plakobranchus ocellatus TaxID=259542 RepID=A0AAV3YEW3_9GAST|nr:hypothetical protein PoB_000716800 [Plakobranchus ocellatus]
MGLRERIKFSVSKTTCVHFHRQRIYTEHALHLDGEPIPVKGSPIKSFYAEAGEPSLEHRLIKLAFNYVSKLKSLPRYPCHDVVFEAPLSDFSADAKSEPNLVVSTFEHIQNAKINLNTIDNLHVQCPHRGRSTGLTLISL